ncbi:MAG: peptidylprolyl isomerase [Bacteroidales bacterium]|nr:peptidylprolyl isomerase [Bacteroidales bacterium]
MIIENNKVVALIYELEVEGAIRDRATREKPLDFIFGQGYLLPEFEANVAGKKVGDTFEFTLSPENGYGVYDPNSVIELPKKIFEIDGQVREGLLTVGNVIPMMTRDGRVVPGKVLEVGDEKIKMDFNHELAGKSLHFTGEVVAVREATDKELEEGLHGERARSCSGNCSDCGGGCR